MHLKFVLGLQAAGHALALAHIALQPKIKRQGQRCGWRVNKPDLAYPRITAHGRGLHIIAVGAGAGLAVKLAFVGRAHIGADVVVDRIAEREPSRRRLESTSLKSMGSPVERVTESPFCRVQKYLPYMSSEALSVMFHT